MRALRTVLALTATGALLVGCSNDASDDNAAEQTTPTTTVTSENPESTATETQSEKTALAQSKNPTIAPTGMLGEPKMEDQPLEMGEPANLVPISVRSGAHDGFDRVVIEFTGEGKPSWYTQYTDDPKAQGSGHSVDYPGNIALVVGVEGTPWPSTPELEEQFLDTGSYPGADLVAGVEYHSTFEAQSQFIIGLNEKMAHSVTVLDNPTRLVIDFKK